MLPEVEYRAVIKYLTKKKLSGKQILEELQCTYGGESPSKTSVYYWVSESRMDALRLLMSHALGVRLKSVTQKVINCYPLFETRDELPFATLQND